MCFPAAQFLKYGHPQFIDPGFQHCEYIFIGHPDIRGNVTHSHSNLFSHDQIDYAETKNVYEYHRVSRSHFQIDIVETNIGGHRVDDEEKHIGPEIYLGTAD